MQICYLSELHVAHQQCFCSVYKSVTYYYVMLYTETHQKLLANCLCFNYHLIQPPQRNHHSSTTTYTQ